MLIVLVELVNFESKVCCTLAVVLLHQLYLLYRQNQKALFWRCFVGFPWLLFMFAYTNKRF